MTVVCYSTPITRTQEALAEKMVNAQGAALSASTFFLVNFQTVAQ